MSWTPEEEKQLKELNNLTTEPVRLTWDQYWFVQMLKEAMKAVKK
jgi:hypothetical protein